MAALRIEEQHQPGGAAMTVNDLEALWQCRSIEVLSEGYLSQCRSHGAVAGTARRALDLVRA